MKERGIIMTGESVRSILAGTKSQTRRVAKIAVDEDGPLHHVLISGSGHWIGYSAKDVPCTSIFECFYGRHGDTLWVREALVQNEDDDGWRYEADGAYIESHIDSPRYLASIAWAHHQEKDRCSSRHMPKWASRLRLKVEDLQLERVQDITEADALAEGTRWGDYFGARDATGVLRAHPTARQAFAAAWDVINGQRAKGAFAWAKNPWTWAITFSRITDTA